MARKKKKEVIITITYKYSPKKEANSLKPNNTNVKITKKRGYISINKDLFSSNNTSNNIKKVLKLLLLY